MTIRPERRIWALGALVGALSLFVVLRLVYLQVWDHGRYTSEATVSQSRKFSIPAERGEIFARDGDTALVPLALNQTLKTVYADPTLIKNKDAAARDLATITGGNQADYRAKLNTKGNYVVLAEKLSADVGNKVEAKNLLGFGVTDQVYRTYPEGDLASQVLGFVNTEDKGQYGVEGYMNKELAGTPGLHQVKTDIRGNPIAIAGSVERPAVNGKSYVLTIDRNIQARAEQALAAGIKDTRAKSGSVVIMDPNTGGIMAMANYPTFDPSNYSKTTDYTTFGNSVVSNQFEPGSGFKIFTMGAALDTGKVRPETTYNDSGPVELDGYKIDNSKDKHYGVQNMGDVIEKSLNTGMIFVLKSLGGDTNAINLAGKKLFHDYIDKFGFGSQTGIEQSSEAGGAVNQPSNRSGNDVNYANMTFGQGISATMIQMVTAASAIANGGKLYQPHVVAGTKQGDTYQPFTPKVVNPQVMSATATNELIGMMERVVQGKYGSGYKARMPGYTVAGKTGTAQIPNPSGKGYRTDRNIGSFVGFAPSHGAKFVMMVRINEPTTEGFAESTTVPVFANIATWLVQYLQIPPQA